jgi:acetoacetyl-CoA synthetase
MSDPRQGQLLWAPRADARATTRMGAFLDWAEASLGVELPTYQAAWEWSVTDLDAFWDAVARWFGVPFHERPRAVLGERSMPGATWFPGATINYAELALASPDDRPALVARSQTRPDVTLTRRELAEQVARVAAGFERLGIGQGDRVVGYLPNVPETIVAFLACASLGAIWSSCAPEFGVRSVIDRVRQIGPKVLLAVDGYRYGERVVERHGEVAAIRAALGTLEHTVVLPYLRDTVDLAAFDAPGAAGTLLGWGELAARPGSLDFIPVAFDHPLYVLYTSGTTGPPKAIVHGHGGIALEHLKVLALHHDLGPDDRLFWFSTTGWMMWNKLVSGLLVGSTLALFDGDPGHPDLTTLWRFAADARVTVFGAGAPFYLRCAKAGLSPVDRFDLSRIRSVCSTGSPLPPEGFAWIYEHVARDQMLGSVSGGTDTCTAFVGSCPLLPVHAGEITCRCLGAKVEAYDEQGRSVVGQRGELVITAPMPSMPVGFWNDPDGAAYRAAYFDHFPGVWRHGDWIEITGRGSCVITGRSDATLNRGGVRLGTSELYSVVESIDRVADSLVIHHDDPNGGPGELILFVVPARGATLDDALRRAITDALRRELSPRHVPDAMHQIPEVPRTISGKKMEVPVKRVLAGEPVEKVANPGAMANPGSLAPFVAMGRPGGPR